VSLPFAEIIHRLMLFARALGFVFPVYFIPVVVRDLIGLGFPPARWMPLFGSEAASVLLPVAVVAATTAMSAVAVLLHSRLAGVNDPLPMLRADSAWRREWGIGLLIGAACATAAVLPALAAGALRIGSFRGVPEPGLLAGLVAVLILEAAREEMGFRGPSLRDLSGALGFPLAAVFLAGSFTLVHAGNPAFGRAGLLGVFLAGLALAGLARARGDLGMVCGLHAGWNLFLAVVWSVPVSGIRAGSALLETQSAGSSPWTGGSFGAEASAPGLLVLAALGFISWRLPARSGPNAGEGSRGGDAPSPAAGDDPARPDEADAAAPDAANSRTSAAREDARNPSADSPTNHPTSSSTAPTPEP
jgi:membrane protease YdiL (CAAX protease family)